MQDFGTGNYRGEVFEASLAPLETLTGANQTRFILRSATADVKMNEIAYPLTSARSPITCHRYPF